jgi:hypothetical protein
MTAYPRKAKLNAVTAVTWTVFLVCTATKVSTSCHRLENVA